MKSLIFDTGPVISLTLNNLLWLLEPLKEKFKGEFYITPNVYKELIEKPLTTKKYKFEALQVLPLLDNRTLKVFTNNEIINHAKELLEKINSIYKADGNWIRIVHFAEMEVIATSLFLGSNCIVIDERTTRKLIEDPESIAFFMEKKLQTKIEVNYKNLNEIKKELGNLKVIRSTELAAISYELGLLDRYKEGDIPNVVKNVDQAILEGVLWGIKLKGCSIKREEIYRIIDLET